MAQLVADSGAVGGVAFVTVDGVTHRLVGEASYLSGDVDREDALGMDGVHGFIEKPVVSVIKGKFRDAGGLRVSSFRGMVDATVVLELINGKTVSGRGMWTTKAEEVDAAEGTFNAEWHCGGGLTEQLAGG